MTIMVVSLSCMLALYAGLWQFVRVDSYQFNQLSIDHLTGQLTKKSSRTREDFYFIEDFLPLRFQLHYLFGQGFPLLL